LHKLKVIKIILSTAVKSISPYFWISDITLLGAGIRLGKVSLPVQQQKQQVGRFSVVLFIHFFNKLQPSSCFHGC